MVTETMASSNKAKPALVSPRASRARPWSNERHGCEVSVAESFGDFKGLVCGGQHCVVLARLGVIERGEEDKEATFRTVDALAFDETFGSAQPTAPRSNFAAQVKHRAQPAGAASCGQRLAGIKMGTVCPAHGSREVLIPAGEVGRPGEQPQVGSSQRLGLVGLGEGVEGGDPQSPLVTVAATFP